MGDGFGTLCTHCQAQEEFLTGVGMNYYSLERFIPFLRGNARKTLCNIIEQHTIHAYAGEHKLYVCTKCNTLHNRFYLTVEYDKGKVFETSYKCSECRTPLILASEPIESHACRKCGKKALSVISEIDWD